MAMSRLSKQQLAGNLAKRILTLDEKIKFLDFAKKNKLGSRKLAPSVQKNRPLYRDLRFIEI